MSSLGLDSNISNLERPSLTTLYEPGLLPVFLVLFFTMHSKLEIVYCICLFRVYVTPLENKLHEGKDFVLFTTLFPKIVSDTKSSKNILHE